MGITARTLPTIASSHPRTPAGRSSLGAAARMLALTLTAMLAATSAPPAGAQTPPQTPADRPAVRSQDPPPPTVETAPAALEVVVNVPAARLDVLREGRVVQSYPATVGARKHPTPIGEFELSRAVWNPWWHPPESDWARHERPQPPGPTNPMGRVKIYYKPLYFIHGTAETEKLGEPASHGCVRLANEDAIALARLVHAAATPQLNPRRIDALLADPQDTEEIRFDSPVPLRIVYRPVEVIDEELVVHPDIYRRIEGRDDLGRRAAEALAASGYAVEEAPLAAALHGLLRKGGRVPLAELVAGAEREEALVTGSGARR